MVASRQLEAIAGACIEAGRQVEAHGSPELRMAMRAVLFILGREIAQQTVQPHLASQHAGTARRRSPRVSKRLN